jgi:hydrogenase-4 component B
LYLSQKLITRERPLQIGPTWACGYEAINPKMQYTGSSYARSFSKLAEPLLSIEKNKKDIKDIFPGVSWFETEPGDKMENILIKYPLKQIRNFLEYFTFLQNGNPRFYILYGLVFITLLLGLPKLYQILKSIIH